MIQELVELIIDFLHDSPSGLKRCSLVGRSWLPACRFHLFSYLALESDENCRYLPARLADAPHLFQLTTHLAIALHPRVAQDALKAACNVLSAIQWTHLRQLTIYSWPSPQMIPILQKLVALPNITHVSVRQTREPEVFFSLFSLRTADLKTLEIMGRDYDYPAPHRDSNQPPAHRFQIDSLYVANIPSERLGDSSSRPFDLSALHRLTVAEYHELSSYQGILRTLGPSLAEVDIAGLIIGRSGATTSLDIGPATLPGLKHFTLHVDTPTTLLGIPSLLSSIPPGASLRQVTLAVSRDCAPTSTDLTQFELLAAWAAIDNALDFLERVSLSIRVTLSAGGALESAVGVSSLRGCLPHLASTRRLLVIDTP